MLWLLLFRPQIEHENNLVTVHRSLGLCQIGNDLAGFYQGILVVPIADPEGDRVRVKFYAGAACRSNDPAPVGVLTVYRRLHERRFDHDPGHFCGSLLFGAPRR